MMNDQATEAITDAWRHMAPTAQCVDAEYQVLKGMLVGSGDVETVYAALARPELPGQLARVRSADAAVTFGRRYGLLGFHDQILDAGDVLGRPEGGFRSQIERKRRTPPGDPIEWVLAHAGVVRLVRELAHGLQRHDTQALTHALDPYRVQREGETAVAVRIAWPGESVPRLMEFPVNVKIPALARRIVAHLVNDNLRARRRVDRESLRPYFTLHALIDHVYWLLADEISGGRLRQCPSCGGIFTATDDRMKYCPPPMGLEGPSRCMNRAKVARWRQSPKRRTRRPRRARP